MYTPSDDTFLLADCIKHYNGIRALEIGVGSGFLLNILEKNFAYVAGSDIDLQVLQYCKKRTSSEKALLVCCDSGSAFGQSKFDLIVSNPPYLPNDDDDEVSNNGKNITMFDPTIHGGPKGIETTLHFVNSALPLLARNGKLLIVISSFADSSALDRVLLENSMNKKVIKQKRLFYETISVVELSL